MRIYVMLYNSVRDFFSRGQLLCDLMISDFTSVEFAGVLWWKMGRLRGRLSCLYLHAGTAWFGSVGWWSAMAPQPTAVVEIPLG